MIERKTYSDFAAASRASGAGDSAGRLASRNPIALVILPVLAAVALTSCASGVTMGVPRAESDRVTQRTVAGVKILNPDQLLVPVLMGSGPNAAWLPCFLDTGSNASVFDVSAKHLLGTKIGEADANVFDRTVRVDLHAMPRASVFGAPLDGAFPAGCMNLADLNAEGDYDTEIQGIIGAMSIRKYALRIDPAEKLLVLFRSDGSPHPEWGESVPMHPSSAGLPIVSGSVGGEAVEFVLDTGLNHTGMLAADKFDGIVAALELETVNTRSWDLAGFAKTRCARFPAISVGPTAARQLILARGTESRLGLSFLMRSKVTIDLPGRRLYLAPTDFKPLPDELDMSGLYLRRMDGKTVVHSVNKDSPADRAGIKAQDAVVHVGEQAAAKMEMWDIRRLLKSGDGKLIKMTVKRGDETFEVSFRLKRRL